MHLRWILHSHCLLNKCAPVVFAWITFKRFSNLEIISLSICTEFRADLTNNFEIVNYLIWSSPIVLLETPNRLVRIFLAVWLPFFGWNIWIIFDCVIKITNDKIIAASEFMPKNAHPKSSWKLEPFSEDFVEFSMWFLQFLQVSSTILYAYTRPTNDMESIRSGCVLKFANSLCSCHYLT